MNSETWQIVNRLFNHCADLPPEQRPGFLAEIEDEKVRSEVIRLLRLDSECQDDFLKPVVQLAASSTFGPGDLIGPYRVDRILGRGGMGEVYASGDLAIKVIRSGSVPNLEKRLRRELITAKRINHPNVCRVFELHEKPLPFLTMELIDGVTLRDRGKLTAEEAKPLIEDMLSGLAAAHKVGVIHRDLKPSNVMLRARERTEAVLMDFGLAIPPEHGSTITPSGQVLGTLDYIAPEQLAGAPATPRSDIYAFGRLLKEMLDGPLTTEWSQAIDACLERDPRERPASAEILLGMITVKQRLFRFPWPSRS